MAEENTRRPRRSRRPTRSRRPLLIVAAIALVIVVLAAVALLSPLLHLREVTVEGASQLDTEEVVTTSGLNEGENLLFTDTDAAAASVSGMPWVKSVTVSRSWPSTVVVDITEYHAVGYIEEDGEPSVVDESGTVFLRGAEPEGTTLIDAEDDDTDAVKAAAKVLAALDEGLLANVEEVDAASAEDITLRFASGREVHWGSADRAEEKAVATELVLTREGQEWNVSNPSVPSVR
ncbi:MAG TPA: FtsQ-type POTRA domain-containing protein [Candidatus Corynebacterium avicola]|uniref:FtsQ-type POTRA domain-containing protein n=1 Tax=Candidatus Corynebacterium avicola TaxID=2838527 RepID=A0A9D1RQX2_9CORY|nr:FtsQ-type POTRA domain-containing protein [Candidatus Corynebacterium avicola]